MRRFPTESPHVAAESQECRNTSFMNYDYVENAALCILTCLADTEKTNYPVYGADKFFNYIQIYYFALSER